ncbi:MAG: DUF3052 domain-containing protein [Actinobacteria bacterium]|uniref:Unannotated protein n=1 Tax=freshwater metagenome TaxID=449393 RepID=A0A6J6SAP1_9ZZZZ|nr:DUF3052 domain-containing protein [Actinomycetota bacterium]
MAGYSGTPLVTKLGIREQHLVLVDRQPSEVDLGDLGGARVVRRLTATHDVALTFHHRRAPLAARLPVLFERTSSAGMVWVCWPKRSARAAVLEASGIVVDLDDAQVRSLGLDLGFVDVKVAAIDDTWSGLKFVRRLADR